MIGPAGGVPTATGWGEDCWSSAGPTTKLLDCRARAAGNVLAYPTAEAVPQARAQVSLHCRRCVDGEVHLCTRRRPAHHGELRLADPSASCSLIEMCPSCLCCAVPTVAQSNRRAARPARNNQRFWYRAWPPMPSTPGSAPSHRSDVTIHFTSAVPPSGPIRDRIMMAESTQYVIFQRSVRSAGPLT